MVYVLHKGEILLPAFLIAVSLADGGAASRKQWKVSVL